MSKQFIIERRKKIANIIQKEGKIGVNEAASFFNVSSETIRKDLAALEKEGLLIKGHGGAIIANKAFDFSIDYRLLENDDLKRKIAYELMNYLPEQSTIFLGSGTTQMKVAELLKDKSGYTIITTNLLVASILSESNNTIMFAGGRIDAHNKSTNGYWTSYILEQINIDFAILGTSGVKGAKGPCTYSYDDLEITKTVLKQAQNKIVIADASKFETTGLFQYARWEEIDLLITNKSNYLEQIKEFVKVVEID